MQEEIRQGNKEVEIQEIQTRKETKENDIQGKETY